MKKSLVALAALAVAGIASAQSSVTLFGVVDAGVRYTETKVNGVQTKNWQLASGGITTSRLGFRGTEDLGGGLAASFWLEAGFNADTGLGNGGRGVPAADSGFNFNRRSTVSLSGGFGEIRLGRDFNITSLNDINFDPFATTGIGSSLMADTSAGYSLTGNTLANSQYFRTNNAVSYFLPGNLGGFYGQLQYAFAEQAKTDGFQTNNSNRNVGGRFGYANGPLDVAVAYGQLNLGAATGAGAAVANVDTTAVKELNLGASYDFGVVKAFGEAMRTKIDNDLVVLNNNNNAYGFLLGATAPVGPGLVRLAYSQVKYSSDFAGADPLSRKLAVGYIHNLSKRTALYTNYARVTTRGQAGLQSNGFDVGLRHAF
jgi:predicted porin